MQLGICHFPLNTGCFQHVQADLNGRKGQLNNDCIYTQIKTWELPVIYFIYKMLLWFWHWERKWLRRIRRQHPMANNQIRWVQRCKRICIQSVQGNSCSYVLIKRNNSIYLISWRIVSFIIYAREYFLMLWLLFFIMSFKTRPNVKNPFFPSVSPQICLLVCSLHRIPPARLLENCKAVRAADQPGRPGWTWTTGFPWVVGRVVQRGKAPDLVRQWEASKSS